MKFGAVEQPELTDFTLLLGHGANKGMIEDVFAKTKSKIAYSYFFMKGLFSFKLFTIYYELEV